jgi:hypothetical protein
MDQTQFDSEILEHETNLPIPFSFKRLISIYRTIGKEYKKFGDNQNALICFNKMLSLSKLWHNFYGHKSSGIMGLEVDKAEKTLTQFLTKHITLYPYSFNKDGAIPNDVLLSATDYKNLRELTLLSSAASDTPKLHRKIYHRQQTVSGRADHENGIPLHWITGEILGKSLGKAVYLGKSGKSLSIETFVLEHYHSLRYEGYWSENEYWWAIMTLLFWDIIFKSIPGAYSRGVRLTQDMPDDFFSPNFYIRRKNMIEKRILELTKPSFLGLKQPNIEKELILSHKKYYWKPCRSMDWEKYPSVEALLLAPKSLGNPKLMSIMKRLISNFNEYRRGLPDLFLVRENSPLFVEVKSENEKVANHQYYWLKFLKENLGIETEICRVIS